MFKSGELTPLVPNKPKGKGKSGTRPKMTTTGPPTPEGLIIQEMDDAAAAAGATIEQPPIIEEPLPTPLVVGRGGKGGRVKKK